MLLRRLAPVGTRLASLPLRRRGRSCMLSFLRGSGARLQQPSSAALGLRWCSSMTPENPATPEKEREEEVLDLPQSGESQRRSYPETAKAYTIKVEGMSEERGRRLTETDVLSLFGNFEPYNINITYNPPPAPRPALPEKQASPKKANEGDGKKKKKGKAGLPPPPPYVSPATVTFQVPSFLYAKELVESFDKTDESWGERITVTREAEMFPVFISGLPVDMDVTAESLKQQFNDLASEPPPYKVEKPDHDPKQKKVPLMEGVHLDLYPYGGYAVIRCLEEVVSLALVQGTLGIQPEDEFKKGKAPVQGKRAVLPDLPDDEVEDDEDDESVMFDEDSSGETGEEGDEGDEEGPELTVEEVQALLQRRKGLPIVYNHPAWKGFAVHVNGLPAETTPEDIEMWFCAHMPYDIDVLPPEPGSETCSAYLRFAKKEGAEGCVLLMNGAEVGEDHHIEVRGAFAKLFPVVMRVEPGADSGALEQVLSAREDIKPLETEVVKGKDEGLTYVLRYTEPQAARDALAALQAVEGLQHAQLGWKPFTLELADLPWDMDENRLRQMIYMAEPYELLMQTTMKKGRRASVSFWTKEEAEKAVMCVKASGYTDIVFRKSWVTYHLKLKNLPMDTTEEELMEVLALHPPYQIDFPLSRRGRRKGQAVLRFKTYDGMLAAIHKLHGRDSPYDEVNNLERFETAGGVAELVVETHGEEKGKEKVGKGKKEGLDAMIRGALQDEEVRKLATELTAGLSGELRERGGDRGKDLELTEEEMWMAEQQEREEAKERVEQMFEEEEEVQVEDDGSGPMLYNPFEFYPEGPWSHFLVDTDTTQKIIKGGHVLSYRALIVTGNGRGCAGWGVGKGATAEEAKVRALHDAKKNLQYVDLYLGRCITTPLYGKHNNCRVVIQAGSANKHHKEGRYVNDMLRLFGVDSGEGRSIGRRNPYSLVRAVFHAMSKHEGVEEIARKRGRRLINVSKARNMGL